MRNALKHSRDTNFPLWYQDVVSEADLAEHSGVRGCMIIKPWGYRIWELIQRRLDDEIKRTGHDNCYFPLFLPLDLVKKEAAHVEGFAKEMAVVTHGRLEMVDGELTPAGPLENPLVIRPTSELVFGDAMSRWITSYRDLPMKLNQWANVVRWEKRTRLFLRTSEFLWQEGHTAHVDEQEARDHTLTMLNVYAELASDAVLLPVTPGRKSPLERFPGADDTLTIEAIMYDGKALQAGTSHFLGQNFSRASNITYQSKDGSVEHPFTTSWGVSTRMIGGLIMVHGDDDGLRLPPKVAPHQVVVMATIRGEDTADAVREATQKLCDELMGQSYDDAPIRVHLDDRSESSGSKRWEWIKKGVPYIIEIGPRELKGGTAEVTCRIDPQNSKEILPLDSLAGNMPEMLETYAQGLWKEASDRRASLTRDDLTSMDELVEYFKGESDLGCALVHWEGSDADEEALNALGITIRCLPFETSGVEAPCIATGTVTKTQALIAKAY